MGVASLTMHFGPFHEPRSVDAFSDAGVVDWSRERGPTCSTLEFIVLRKQFLSTANTCELSIFFGEMIVSSGSFGRVFTGYLVCEIRELFSPFVIGFDNFFGHSLIPVGVVER